MPISVKDIQEKEFSRQKRDGYMVEEVDDFLDQIADQLSVLIRENMALAEKLKAAESAPAPLFAQEPAPAPVAPAPAAPSGDPAYDEPSYFKNLELAMRDTLIGAQRIADDTVADARKKAQQLVSAAEEQAAQIAASAKAEAETVKAEAEGIRKSISGYCTAFRRLVEGQVKILKDTESLFD